MMNLTDINFLAVLIAALSSFLIGSLWYSPLLFGRIWQKSLGFSDEYLKNGNMIIIFGLSFLLQFIMALGLAFLLNLNKNEHSWITGLTYGLFVGIFFISTSYGVNLLYQRKSFKLWIIDAGYQVILLGVMGIIIAVW